MYSLFIVIFVLYSSRHHVYDAYSLKKDCTCFWWKLVQKKKISFDDNCLDLFYLSDFLITCELEDTKYCCLRADSCSYEIQVLLCWHRMDNYKSGWDLNWIFTYIGQIVVNILNRDHLVTNIRLWNVSLRAQCRGLSVGHHRYLLSCWANLLCKQIIIELPFMSRYLKFQCCGCKMKIG